MHFTATPTASSNDASPVATVFNGLLPSTAVADSVTADDGTTSSAFGPSFKRLEEEGNEEEDEDDDIDLAQFASMIAQVAPVSQHMVQSIVITFLVMVVSGKVVSGKGYEWHFDRCRATVPGSGHRHADVSADDGWR